MQHLRTTKQWKFSRFTFIENTITNSSRARSLESDRHFCLKSCLNSCLKDLLYYWKREVISKSYGSIKSSPNMWWWGLAWHLQCGINTSIPTLGLTHSAAAAKALSLTISSHGTSLKWFRRPFQLTWEQSKLCNEKNHPSLSLKKRQWKLR